MNRCYGKSGWCSACNQWQIIVIVILFLSLFTYGIFKLTQDPYRTIMGELCDLPQPLRRDPPYYWSKAMPITDPDTLRVTSLDSDQVYHYRIAVADTVTVDTSYTRIFINWEAE